jgi:hypothetical protein
MKKSLEGLYCGKKQEFSFYGSNFMCVVGHFANNNQDVELLVKEDIEGKN